MIEDDTMLPEMELLKDIAKQKHAERVAKTPQRIEYAKQQFERNGIKYVLKNSENGHFHCFDKNGNLIQFWCSTGKVYYNYKTAQKNGVKTKCQIRGIRNLIKLMVEVK